MENLKVLNCKVNTLFSMQAIWYYITHINDE